ncbi:MAG: glycosyltransferase family 2 protein [Candidatus Thermoplasmatota archaeon]|nr:glycosyltransferase family 2 protein [Candidatus Thermoplasmatota archaeon]MCL5438308.1 glycosyltransferase family 2 protein [Candidatus Thermoplasmatota archaeon]
MSSDLVLQILFYIFISYLFLLLLFFSALQVPRWKPESFQAPDFKIRVIVPCKGVDLTLEENLKSIMRQSYRDYSVIAVVDSEDDPSCEILRKVGLEYIVSEAGDLRGSGKVRAVYSALLESTEQVIVIADSDITVEKDWLERLVQPLMSLKYGISTTFPLFEPVGGFWSRFKALWGTIGIGMMESKLTRFAWGGSLAFRRSILSGKELEFGNQISDDIFLTKACLASGLQIYYSPEARAVIHSDDDFATFFEWSNRQTALSISSGSKVLYYGIILYFNQILLYSMAIFLSFVVTPLFLLLLIPYLLNVLRTLKRIPFRFPMIIPGSFILPFFYLLNLLVAGGMHKITWRGSVYSLR